MQGFSGIEQRLMVMRNLVIVLLFSSWLSGCGGALETNVPTHALPPSPTITASSSTTPTVVPTSSEAAIQAGIQQTLDRFAKAYNENNLDLLRQTVDQTNLPFRRLVEERFKEEQRGFQMGSIVHRYHVQSIRQRDHGFIQAHIVNHNTEANDWLFRNVKGQWLLSEPTKKQIGERKVIESEHFSFTTYPWADDVTPKLVPLMEQAYHIVKQRLGKVEDSKARVSIEPIYGLRPMIPTKASAFYDESGKGQIIIFSPHSFSFPAYNQQEGWEGILQVILAHEYTHMVNDHHFTPLVRMSPWMSEGIAEYISQSPLIDTVPLALEKGIIIPLIDPEKSTNPQDLEHLTGLEKDKRLAYGFSQALVRYIVETYGGLDGFWKFVAIYGESPNLEKAIQEAFGVSYQQFNSDWQAWLLETYGS